MSAFFFRARGSAAARRDGGLKEGGAVYAVSARGSDAVPGCPECYSYSLRTDVDGVGFGPPRRVAPPYGNLDLIVRHHLPGDGLAKIHLTLFAFGSRSLRFILKLGPSVRTVVHLSQTRSRMAAASALLPANTLTQSA